MHDVKNQITSTVVSLVGETFSSCGFKIFWPELLVRFSLLSDVLRLSNRWERKDISVSFYQNCSLKEWLKVSTRESELLRRLTTFWRRKCVLYLWGSLLKARQLFSAIQCLKRPLFHLISVIFIANFAKNRRNIPEEMTNFNVITFLSNFSTGDDGFINSK